MLIFRERLKALREQHGYDQRDMGEKLNITASAYGFYEQGRNEPSLETLKKLAAIFQVSTDYLLGLSNTENNSSIFSLTEKLYLSDNELIAIQEMKKCSLLSEISKNTKNNVHRLKRYWEFIQKEHDIT